MLGVNGMFKIIASSVIIVGSLVSAQAVHAIGDSFQPGPGCGIPESGDFEPVLVQGNYGMNVEYLQFSLGIVPQDGCFGPQTHQAVGDFQACHGLTVDGVVGPQTWRAIGKDLALAGCPRGAAFGQSVSQDLEPQIIVDQWREVVRLKLGDTTVHTFPMIDNHNVLAKGEYPICEFKRTNWDKSGTWTLKNFVRLCREDGTRTGMGFHAIPVSRLTGKVMHDDSFLGTGKRQSSGCIRLSLADSLILWDFAVKGMRVVVQ